MDALSSFINLLETPIAKRKGVRIPEDECKIWAEELSKTENPTTPLLCVITLLESCTKEYFFRPEECKSYALLLTV